MEHKDEVKATETKKSETEQAPCGQVDAQVRYFPWSISSTPSTGQMSLILRDEAGFVCKVTMDKRNTYRLVDCLIKNLANIYDRGDIDGITVSKSL